MEKKFFVSFGLFLLSQLAFGETIYEKAAASFKSAQKVTTSQVEEIASYKHTNCVVKMYPNRISDVSVRIFKENDVVLGASLRLYLDSRAVTMVNQSNGDTGFLDVSSSGHVMGKTTLRKIESPESKPTWIIEDLDFGGNEPLSSFCWWR